MKQRSAPFTWLSAHGRAWAGILLLFILPRLLSLTQPYYQDEVGMAIIADAQYGLQGQNPHPPLGEALHSLFGLFSGYDHLRLLPFTFSVANLFLVYGIASLSFGPAAGLMAAAILAGTFYSVWASTMIDVDGAILPFFALLALFLHLRGRSAGAETGLPHQTALAAVCAAGLLIKLVFLVMPVILLAEMGCSSTRDARSRMRQGAVFVALLLAWCLAGLFALRILYPSSHLNQALSFAQTFNLFDFSGPTLAHKAYESAKCILYASPFLLAAWLHPRFLWSRGRPIVLFVVGFVALHLFVLGLHGRPLDRYFALCVPFAVILVAGSLRQELTGSARGPIPLRSVSIGILLALLPLGWLAPMPRLIPLYPKRGFLDAILTLRWDTLVPFRGGNGPGGFYAPTGLLLSAWLISIPLLILVPAAGKTFRRSALVVTLLAVAGVYNLFLIEEHLLGLRYGSPIRLGLRATQDIVQDPGIKSVITYDNRNRYELIRAGKYAARFYAVPDYWEANRRKFREASDSHFLVVDFPLIARNGPYWHYLETCAREREWQDGLITAFLARCPTPEGP